MQLRMSQIRLRRCASEGRLTQKRKGPRCGPFSNASNHPHLLYPQFKQVAHPSMITTALVLHLWHMAADGGKDAPSPVTSMDSSCDSFSVARSATVALTSGFFFEPCRCS